MARTVATYRQQTILWTMQIRKIVWVRVAVRVVADVAKVKIEPRLTAVMEVDPETMEVDSEMMEVDPEMMMVAVVLPGLMTPDGRNNSPEPFSES